MAAFRSNLIAKLPRFRDTRFTASSFSPCQRLIEPPRVCYSALAGNAETLPVFAEKMPLANLCN